MAKLIVVHDEEGEEHLINADRIVMVRKVSVVPRGQVSITMTMAGGDAVNVKENFRQLQALVNAK
jgi:hypothetical protein